MAREPSMSIPSASNQMEKSESLQRKPYQTMRGHTERVSSVVQLPDGRRITCSADGSLRLWDQESGAQIGNDWRDRGDEEVLWAIALSPNKKMVATGSLDGTVRVWDIEMRKVAAKWTGHTSTVESVCWSADGERVVTASHDGTVRVWEVESGETVLGPIKTGHGSVFTVVYSPDASKLATGGYDNGIQVWDARTGELLSTLEQNSFVSSLAWTSDQNKLIAGSGRGSISTFNTATWQQIAVLEDHHRSHVFALSLFQNDRLLASGSSDRTARLWNLDTNHPVGPPIQHQHWVHGVSFSADGKSLVTACRDSNAYVWDIHTILKEAGLEDLLSFSNNATNVKSILNADATRRPTKPKVPQSIPQGFFDDERDGVHSSTTRTDPPPAARTDPPPDADQTDPLSPPSTTTPEPPSSMHRRRHPFASLLGRVLARFHHPQSIANQSANLQQHINQPAISVHGPIHFHVPVVQDNQSDASQHVPQLRVEESLRQLPSIVGDARHRIHPSTTRTHPPSEHRRRHPIAPSSESGSRPVRGRFPSPFRSSRPNNIIESTELQQFSAQHIPVHEPAIVAVPEGRDNQPLYVAPPPVERPSVRARRIKNPTRWMRFIFTICCVGTDPAEGN